MSAMDGLFIMNEGYFNMYYKSIYDSDVNRFILLDYDTGEKYIFYIYHNRIVYSPFEYLIDRLISDVDLYECESVQELEMRYIYYVHKYIPIHRYPILFADKNIKVYTFGNSITDISFISINGKIYEGMDIPYEYRYAISTYDIPKLYPNHKFRYNRLYKYYQSQITTLEKDIYIKDAVNDIYLMPQGTKVIYVGTKQYVDIICSITNVPVICNNVAYKISSYIPNICRYINKNIDMIGILHKGSKVIYNDSIYKTSKDIYVFKLDYVLKCLNTDDKDIRDYIFRNINTCIGYLNTNMINKGITTINMIKENDILYNLTNETKKNRGKIISTYMDLNTSNIHVWVLNGPNNTKQLHPYPVPGSRLYIIKTKGIACTKKSDKFDKLYHINLYTSVYLYMTDTIFFF